MNKLSIIAAATAIAASVASPVAAQEKSQDPFVSTAGAEVLPLIIIGGLVAIIGIVGASSGTK